MDSKSKVKCPLPDNLRFLKISDRELQSNDCLRDHVNTHYSNRTKEKVIVTYGKEGCIYNGKRYPSPVPRETRDVSGAGDTFLAALAVAYVKENKNIDSSIEYANECAGIVVTKRGVVTL